ncbi:MAG: HlyD family secretion protein, partial [Burkholderiaceae bacterium]|nr:HlyD family secretion protein [Burkholderiaceae bacterium]
MTIVSHLRSAFACLLMATLLAGCGGKADKPGKAAAGSGAPVSVTTVEVRQRDLAVQLEATATVVPVASVEVRSQLTSVVRKVHIKEGQFVRAGELLFTLDVRTDEANVAKLRAQMARD